MFLFSVLWRDGPTPKGYELENSINVEDLEGEFFPETGWPLSLVRGVFQQLDSAVILGVDAKESPNTLAEDFLDETKKVLLHPDAEKMEFKYWKLEGPTLWKTRFDSPL